MRLFNTKISLSSSITPLFYFGQRESIIPDLFSLLGSKKYRRFFDPFSGSGSIGFAAMRSAVAEEYYINDSLPALKNLWEVVKQEPESLIASYNKLIEKYKASTLDEKSSFYKKSLEEFKCRDKQNSQQSAAIFCFLINLSKNNIPIFNKSQELVSEPNIEIKPDASQINLTQFRQKIISLSHLFKQNQVIFSTGDYPRCIAPVAEGDVIIFDPPYPYQAENIYFNLREGALLKTQLGETFRTLGQKKVDFIVMYGAGLIPLAGQWADQGLQHLLRLSYHPLYGEFLEHIYVSPSIPLTTASLPEKIMFYDHVFKLGKEVSEGEYADALSYMRPAKPQPTLGRI